MLVETKARVGVFAIALGAYLPQFPTLVPEFEGQYAAFKKTLPDTVEHLQIRTVAHLISHLRCQLPLIGEANAPPERSSPCSKKTILP